MLETLRSMPSGVRVFLAYAFAVLAIVGLTLPLVVDQAVEAPVSGIGLIWMLLLAYLIFTITLVLQRKQAAYMLSLGLSSLTIPLIGLLALYAGLPGAIFALVLAVILFRGLRRPASRSWFREP
jgi:nitrogen fixation/metabolism regulation signal transduction histidine kinase